MAGGFEFHDGKVTHTYDVGTLLWWWWRFETPMQLSSYASRPLGSSSSQRTRILRWPRDEYATNSVQTCPTSCSMIRSLSVHFVATLDPGRGSIWIQRMQSSMERNNWQVVVHPVPDRFVCSDGSPKPFQSKCLDEHGNEYWPALESFLRVWPKENIAGLYRNFPGHEYLSARRPDQFLKAMETLADFKRTNFGHRNVQICNSLACSTILFMVLSAGAKLWWVYLASFDWQVWFLRSLGESICISCVSSKSKCWLSPCLLQFERVTELI